MYFYKKSYYLRQLQKQQQQKEAFSKGLLYALIGIYFLLFINFYFLH